VRCSRGGPGDWLAIMRIAKALIVRRELAGAGAAGALP
jgi:hypothetical protein